MKPSFTIKKDERLYITKDYYTNGHWMLKRDAIIPRLCPLKPLAALNALQTGTYADGIGNGKSTDDPPGMTALVPKRDGYLPLNPAPVGVTFKNETEISAYKFRVAATTGTPEFEIGLAHRYVPLLALGYPFARDAKSPILLLSENNLYGEFIGVVMPVRLYENCADGVENI